MLVKVAMAFNKGQFYHREKNVTEELTGQIIYNILESGGDRSSGYFPRNCEQVWCPWKDRQRSVAEICS